MMKNTHLNPWKILRTMQAKLLIRLRRTKLILKKLSLRSIQRKLQRRNPRSKTTEKFWMIHWLKKMAKFRLLKFNHLTKTTDQIEKIRIEERNIRKSIKQRNLKDQRAEIPRKSNQFHRIVMEKSKRRNLLMRIEFSTSNHPLMTSQDPAQNRIKEMTLMI